LESFVLNDNIYTQEKENAENATLPLNVQKIGPPSNLDNTTVRNYLIDQKNISRISGISANDSCIIYSTGDSGQKQTLNFCNPPDVQIAPGKNHVIEMTNNFIGVWNKSDILSNKSLLEESKANNPIYWTNNFFKINPKNDTFDPSIIYDSTSHRWLSTLVEFEIPHGDESRKSDKMGMILSYSAPDNYKRWTVMKFSPRLILPTETSYYCPDRPMIYASTDKVLISMTISDPVDKQCSEENKSTRYLLMAIFNKTQLFDDTYMKKDFDVMYVYDRNYHYVPVKSNSERAEIDLVNISPYADTNLRLTYLKISGSLDKLSKELYERDLAYKKSIPPNAVQKGTNTKLYIADNRIIDAVETRNNEVWFTFHNNCNVGGHNTSCIRLVKLTVDKNSPSKHLETFAGGTNTTTTSYEAGNMTAPTDVSEMASNGSLPFPVASNVLSQIIADPKIQPIVVDKVTPELKKIIPNNVNHSEIVKIVENASLPSPVANSVVSDLVADPKYKSMVLDEVYENLDSHLPIKRDLDFQIGSDNYYYYYPTIAISKNGSLVVYFGFSSNTSYPSLGLLVLNPNSLSQSGNSVEGPLKYDPILIRNGTTFAKEENITKGGGCNLYKPCTRYGDYFSINTDPFNDTVLWAAGEYYDSKYFSTIISNIRLP
jgi:hypothetical protein